MKFILLITILLGAISNSSAQQEGQFIQLVNNQYLLNPAAGGFTKATQLELGMRNQWTGFANSPESFIFSGHGRLGSNATLASSDGTLFRAPEVTGGEIKHVIGGIALSETMGPFNRINVQGSYAVHMPLYKDISIGAGLSAGITNFGIIEDRVILYEQDDDAYMQFLGGTSNQTIFNMNGGLVLYHPSFTVGFSTIQMLNNDLIFGGIPTGSNFNRHYYLTANYGFKIQDKWEVRPTLITQFAKNTPINILGAAKFSYNNSVWALLGYRTSGTMAFQIGANLFKQFYLAYAFEAGVGKFQTSGAQTHEIQLGFYLGKKQSAKNDSKEESEQEIH